VPLNAEMLIPLDCILFNGPDGVNAPVYTAVPLTII